MGFMEQAEYGADQLEAAEQMLRKQGIKRNSEVQALEDVICFVFLKWYFAPFRRQTLSREDSAHR